jgi:hypothetical protein
MARVLTMIETTCPSALSKKVSTDEVMINFDALTPRCFHDVNSFVLACFLHISGAKKGKKRKSMNADPPTEMNLAAAAESAAALASDELPDDGESKGDGQGEEPTQNTQKHKQKLLRKDGDEEAELEDNEEE